VAIVGAGISGAICASKLRSRGVDVVVFDKGRSPGGRMSCRRADTGHRFDHGVPGFDGHDVQFIRAATDAVEAGILTRHGELFCGVGAMNVWCKHLMGGIQEISSTKIIAATYDRTWQLSGDAGAMFGPFDAVVLAVPPTNAVEILGSLDQRLSAQIDAIKMMPRWVAMLGFDRRLKALSDHLSVDHVTIHRSMSNTVGDALVVHADEAWSMEHLERPAAEVAGELARLARDAIGQAWVEPVVVMAHRWRYAFARESAGVPFFESSSNLFVCGDWCLGRSVESGYLSGSAVADRLDAL